MTARIVALFLLISPLASCAGSKPLPKAAPSAPQTAIPTDPDALLSAIQEAYKSGDFGRGLLLVKRLVEVTPDKVTAYDRIGSTYFALGRTSEALGMWETALSLESNAKRKADLAASVALTRKNLGLPEAKLPTPAAPPPRKPPKRKAVDPKEAERLYQLGVEKFAKSEYMAATTLFMRALTADPKHEPSRKALERLKLK